jgi:hypothetical protein
VHDDHFADDCPDEDWLPAVGRRGWVVITRDLKIRYRAIEKEAALASGVRMISLTARRLSAGELGEAFVASSARVMRLLDAQRSPFIATMTRGGVLRIVASNGERSRDRR